MTSDATTVDPLSRERLLGRTPLRIAQRSEPVEHARVEGEERFAAYIAHELRTPLATQRSLLELALGDPSTDAAGWRQIGEDVLDACRQQERLLNACLNLARSQNGLNGCETVDLSAVAAKLLGAREFRGLTVRSRLGRALTTGDPALIGRLVENLLVNAVRHNRVGGWIDVTTRQTGTSARFTVANTGPPIAAGEVARLFEPFQQLRPNAHAADGVGLGLAIVQTIATAHDARVTTRARSTGGLNIDVAFHALA